MQGFSTSLGLNYRAAHGNGRLENAAVLGFYCQFGGVQEKILQKSDYLNGLSQLKHSLIF